jgi:hypothetical protein
MLISDDLVVLSLHAHLGAVREANDDARHVAGVGAADQGLTLVHFSAHPEPFLAQNTP